MVGDGPDRGPAEHLARRLKVDSDVIFLGKQDHVERLIPAGARAADAERDGIVRAGRRWKRWPAAWSRWPRASAACPS